MQRFKFNSYPYLLALLLLPCFPISGQAAKVFDFNAACRQAYGEIIRLKLPSGQQILALEKKAHPDNLIPYFLENYIDFIELFFNEDPEVYKQREENEEKRLSLMSLGPDSSPFYLFTKSVIHFQWAAVKIKFGHNWDAGWEFRRSFIQGRENQHKFPSFSPNAMLNGSMQVVAGTIPEGYKWLSSLLGIKGSIREGMQQLGQFLEPGDDMAGLYHDEALFYYLYLKFYIANRKEEVFDYLSGNKLDVVNNHLFTYLAANLGINGQHSAYAKKVLTQKNDAPLYLDMPVWDMEMGYAALNHLDGDADFYLKRFIRQFKGRFYVKDVLQKLSWFYYLKGDMENALAYRALILKRGGTEAEADKQAQEEASRGTWPNRLLLKARLLNDGGYHQEALQLLEGRSIRDFAAPEDKLEFTYWLGRIYDDSGRKQDAITAYLTTLQAGSQSSRYFAARAALQIGYIYESKGQKSNAIVYFKKCISLKNHDYKNSLDQKAKAGISRCENE